jgi:hypothetical protein
VSAQQGWNLQQSATARDLILVQRENGDLDVVTTEYITELPTYGKLPLGRPNGEPNLYIEQQM